MKAFYIPRLSHYMLHNCMYMCVCVITSASPADLSSSVRVRKHVNGEDPHPQDYLELSAGEVCLTLCLSHVLFSACFEGYFLHNCAS